MIRLRQRQKFRDQDCRVFWRDEEDQILKRIKAQGLKQTWKEISKFVQGRSANACVQRWKRIRPVKSNRQKWSPQEDSLLIELEALYDNNWQMIANQMIKKTGLQVRERYMNHLQKGIIKTKWTQAEDEKLLKLYQTYGNSWSKISKFMTGRPVNQIKNKFYGHITKIIQNPSEQLVEINNIEMESEFNSSQYFMLETSTPLNILSYPQ